MCQYWVDSSFSDSDTNTCLQCAPLCSRCETSSTYCTACKPHALLTNEHTCQQTCSVNEYLEADRCRTCSGSCHTCSGSQADNCLSCVPGRVLKERTCVEEWTCTDGYYIREGLGDNTRECIRYGEKQLHLPGWLFLRSLGQT